MIRAALALGLSLLVAASPAWAAAPTFETASSHCDPASGTITVTHTVTLADGLYIGVGMRGTIAVTTVTWDGSATGVTRVTGRDDGGGNSNVDLWKLIAPTAGTHDVVVTTTDSQNVCVGVIGLIGTHQTTPVTASATNGDTTGGSASLTVNVTSSSSELVVGVGTQTGGAHTFTSTGTGQTERLDDSDGTGISLTMATQTGAATTTHSYTASNAKEWTTIAASVQAPAAGGGNKAGGLVSTPILKGLVGGGLVP